MSPPLLVIELGMVLYGLLLVVWGRTGLAVTSAEGPLVRTAGLVFMLPMSISLLASHVLGTSGASRDQVVSAASTIGFVAVLACGTVGTLFCLNAGRPGRGARAA